MNPEASQPQESQKNSPFPALIARCNEELAKALKTLNPGDPKILTLIDNLARLQQIVVVDRLHAAIDQATTDRERMKFLRLLNQTLSLQQRTNARIQREALAREKEALKAERQRARQVAKPPQPPKPLQGIPTRVRVHGLPIPFLGPAIEIRRPDIALRMESLSRRGNRLRPSLIPHYNRAVF